MRACFVNSVGMGLIAALWSCGSGVVDVGTLPDDGDSNENQGPDAGGSNENQGPDAGGSGGGGFGCNIPDLGRYKLVFDSDGGRLERRIYTMRADGSELEAITPVEELAREPSMAPDGSQLAYATPEGLKLLDVGTGASELLVSDAAEPSFSADGSQLLYRSGFSSISPAIDILRLSDRFNDPEFLIPAHTFSHHPAWAPDGNHVVLVPNATAIITQDIGPPYGSRELVPTSLVQIAHPTVSPDGIWVTAAFVCPGTTDSSLWASPYAVSTPACEGRRVTPVGAVTATNPKWGPGVLIAYERGEPPRDIAIIAADTGEECVIQGPGDDRNPSWVSSSFDEPE